MSKLHKIGDAYLQYARNQYARFEQKEWKLLELHITQCKYQKGGVDVIMS